MQFRIFSIPVMGDPSSEAELNAFLRAHRVISVRRELVQPEGAAFWSFCVEYLDGHSVAVRSGDSKPSEIRQRATRDSRSLLSTCVTMVNPIATAKSRSVKMKPTL